MTTPSKTLLALALLVIPSAGCDAGSDSSTDSAAAAPAPDDYDHYIVYVAGGDYDPNDPDNPQPTLEQIQREVWGFSDAEIEAFEADAKAFYLERFGIDADDPANAERILLTTFTADPRARYRVATMSEHEVPTEGWPVSDGALNLVIVDPEGFELGGEFEGQHAPAGSFLSFGRYDIHLDDGEQLPIYFKSVSPIVVDPYGLGAFLCDLSSETLGEGQAYGVYQLTQQLDGTISAYGRNVLTFE